MINFLKTTNQNLRLDMAEIDKRDKEFWKREFYLLSKFRNDLI